MSTGSISRLRSILYAFLGYVFLIIMAFVYVLEVVGAISASISTVEGMTWGLPDTRLVEFILLVLDIALALFTGYFTVAIAGNREIKHVLCLAMFMFVMRIWMWTNEIE